MTKGPTGVTVFHFQKRSLVAIELQPVTKNEFTVPGRYPLLVKFTNAGEVTINPGRWQQTRRRAP